MIATRLAEDPFATSGSLLDAVRQLGYGGGKSAFYELVDEVRRSPNGQHKPGSHLPGAVARHAWCQASVDFSDGTWVRAHFLVTWFPYSGQVRVSEVNPGIEVGLRALLDHYAVLGGRPLVAVSDDPGPFGERARWRGQVVWDPAVARLMLDLEMGLAPLEPDQLGWDGAVPHLGRWAKRSLLRRGAYRNHAEMETRLASCRIEPHPADALDRERARLRPLVRRGESTLVWFAAHADSTACVQVEDRSYRLPEDLAGLPVMVGLTSRAILAHPRDRSREGWRASRLEPQVWKPVRGALCA